jgi:hypothetical protein
MVKRREPVVGSPEFGRGLERRINRQGGWDALDSGDHDPVGDFHGSLDEGTRSSIGRHLAAMYGLKPPNRVYANFLDHLEKSDDPAGDMSHILNGRMRPHPEGGYGFPGEGTMPKAKGGRANKPSLSTVENILDLTPKGYQGPGVIGRAGPDGSERHHVPIMSDRIRSTVHGLAGRQDRHRGHWMIGRNVDEAAKAYQKLGGDPASINHPEFGMTTHRNEESLMRHLADQHGYDNVANMAQDLSTPQAGGEEPEGFAKGGQSRRNRRGKR